MLDRNFLLAMRKFAEKGSKKELLDEINILLEGPNYEQAPILTAPGVLPEDAEEETLADDAGNTLVGGAVDDREVNSKGLPVKGSGEKGPHFDTDSDRRVESRADTERASATRTEASAPTVSVNGKETDQKPGVVKKS